MGEREGQGGCARAKDGLGVECDAGFRFNVGGMGVVGGGRRRESRDAHDHSSRPPFSNK
jgi:hypothetical protein